MRKSRRKKTFDEIIELKEDQTYVSGAPYYVAFTMVDKQKEDSMVSYAELLDRFYDLNRELYPLAFKSIQESHNGFTESNWYAVCYGRFYIRIECHHKRLHGPHRCQLFYKCSYVEQSHWLASCQVFSFFHNYEEMIKAMMDAISFKQFYMTDKEREIAIYL